MARKKKSEPIIGICRDPENRLVVQKSRPLFSLWQSDLTLAEFKILDTYLSRINSHDPEHREVVLEKGEIEKLLGVKKLNLSELRPRLKHLMGQVIEVDDSTAKTKSARFITLFEECFVEQDEEDGLWKVRLECTRKAMKYFFNIEKLGYLRYKLRCVTSLTSRYSYIMFVYLEANRFRGSWQVDLQELKEILNCHEEETYKEFKFFNQKILQKIQKEIHEKTELRYSYEPIKKGRKVVAIRFTVETLKDLIEQEPVPEIPERVEKSDWQLQREDDINNYRKQCGEEFDFEETEYLVSLISEKGIEYCEYNKICDYLTKMYRKLNVAAKRTDIRDRYNYFVGMIEKDVEKSKERD